MTRPTRNIPVTEIETEELMDLAAQLSQMPLPRLTKKAKKSIAMQIGIRRRPFIYRHPRLAFASGGFALFLALVLIAQSARPGTPLYALRKGSDHVRVLLQPGFKSELEKEQPFEDEGKSRRSSDGVDDTSTGSDDSRRSGSNSGSGSNEDSSHSESESDLNNSGSGSTSSGTSGDSKSDDKAVDDKASGSGTNSNSTSERSGDSGSGSGSGGHGSDDKPN